MSRLLILFAALLSLSSVQAANVVVYTDFALWAAAAGAPLTIDFETPDASAGNVLINGDEYAGLAGSPNLSFTPTPGLNTADGNGDLQVGEAVPGALDVGPSSGDQLLFPGLFKQGAYGNGGVLRLTADQPLNAAAAVFSDIEAGETTTGFDLDLDGSIDVLFSDWLIPVEGATLFLGFVTDMPVAAVDIHVNSANGDPNNGADGVGLDDLSYNTVVPIPAAAWLFVSALAGLGWFGRRKA